MLEIRVFSAPLASGRCAVVNNAGNKDLRTLLANARSEEAKGSWCGRTLRQVGSERSIRCHSDSAVPFGTISSRRDQVDPVQSAPELRLTYPANSRRFDESAQIAAISELLHRWMPGSSIPSESVPLFCGRLNANSFKLPSTSDNKAEGLRAVYYLASKIGHSCIPNAIKTVCPDGQITVRATVFITKGARITFNHAGPLWGKMKRRFELTQTKFGTCNCERCSDPSELGTFASGIFCRKCPNQEGILISVNPLDEMSDWTCNKCSDKKSIDFVANLLDKVVSHWGRLNRFSIAKCEAFVRKYGMILHPNHYYMTDIKVCLCTNYGHVDNTNHMDDKILDKKEVFVSELLKVADVVSPGLSRLRGILRYHLYAVHDYRFMKLVNSGNVPPEELQSQLKKIHVILKEVITINSWEPEETVKGNLSKQLKQKLKNDECFLVDLEMKQMMNDVLNM